MYHTVLYYTVLRETSPFFCIASTVYCVTASIHTTVIMPYCTVLSDISCGRQNPERPTLSASSSLTFSPRAIKLSGTTTAVRLTNVSQEEVAETGCSQTLTASGTAPRRVYHLRERNRSESVHETQYSSGGQNGRHFFSFSLRLLLTVFLRL